MLAIILGPIGMIIGIIKYCTPNLNTSINEMFLIPFYVFSLILICLVIKKLFDIFLINRYKRKIKYKNIENEFYDFYQSLKLSYNDTLNRAKKNSMAHCSFIIFLIGFMIFSVTYSAVKYIEIMRSGIEIDGTKNIVIGTIGLILFVLMLLEAIKIVKQKVNDYRFLYKNAIISPLVKIIDVSFEYIPTELEVQKKNFYLYNHALNKKKDDYEYEDSRLEKESYNDYIELTNIDGWDNKLSIKELDINNRYEWRYKRRD